MDPPFTQDIEEKGDVPYVINHIHTSLAKHAFESRLAWPECLDAATLRHLVTRSSDYFMSGRQSGKWKSHTERDVVCGLSIYEQSCLNERMQNQLLNGFLSGRQVPSAVPYGLATTTR